MALLKILLVLSALFAVRGQKQDYVYEFEDVLNESQKHEHMFNWQWRSTASGHKTLRIEDEQGSKNVSFTLCIKPTAEHSVFLLIKNIVYSNYGDSDVVKVRFNNFQLGSFSTSMKLNSGNDVWDAMQNSGKVGLPVPLAKGTYIMAVSVKTDSFGVELDRIVFETKYQDPTQNLVCGAQYED